MNVIATDDVNEKVTQVAHRFFTVKKFAKKNTDAGVWPSSESAIWALRAGAPQNGFGDAFLKVGRRVLVAEDKFWTAIELLQEVNNV